MKAPAGRPGLDVLRGGERAAPRCRHLPAEARAAGRGPRAIKGRRAAGRAPPAGGARAAGGAQRLRLLINPGNRALPARHEGRSQGRRVGRPGVWPPSRGAPCAASAGEPEGPPTGRGSPGGLLELPAHFRGSSDPGARRQGPCAGPAFLGAVYHFT